MACEVLGCLDDHKASGLCAKHYQRQHAGRPLLDADDVEAAEMARAADADPFYDVPLLGTFRVTDHRCGKCQWEGTGRSDCVKRVLS